MTRAVIFDCFGVIIGQGFEATYRSAGGDPVADKHFIDDVLGQANIGSISETDFNQQIADQLGISLEAWGKAVQRAEQPDEALLEYIKSLRGQYKTAVLSNANKGVVVGKIGEDWVERCFDAVIVSGEVGMIKPDTEMYQHAADQLDVVPEECIFLDDLDRHVAGAREAGMQAILYKDFVQATAELEKILDDSK